jgi:hypothetical protein
VTKSRQFSVRLYRVAGMAMASIFSASIVVLAGIVLSASSAVAVTHQGYNAVCSTSSLTCATTAPSAAFIDASAFCPSGGCSGVDFCATVNAALQALQTLSPTLGGVVDARGINPSGANTCANSPFTHPVSVSIPSTILLPSGSITIDQTWTLPDRTRIIGQGNNSPGDILPAGTPNGTEVIVESSGFPGSAMIQMGNSTYCTEGPNSDQCFGVSVESVFLSGGGNHYSMNGIVNDYAGESSYVDHVNFGSVEGTGLMIGLNAANSGPYSNLAMSAAGQCVAATSCVQLGDSNNLPLSTRGIHGMTCTCSSGAGAVGVALNSSNNTLEDIHFEGFVDGIQAGNTGTVRGNVLLNVNGGSGKDSMTSVIHICESGAPRCGTPSSVSDLAIVQAYAQPGGMSDTVKYVIQDDVTSTNIAAGTAGTTPTTVGMYILGNQMAGGGYSRFATTPVAPVPSWDVWDSQASTSVSCQSGSLLSNVKGIALGTSGNYTFWVCKSGHWASINH